jgi:protein transport protein SEC23
MQFIVDEDPRPVMLDTSSLQKNRVLLLDTIFRVVVWHGSDAAAWRNAKYHEQLRL